MINTVEVDLLLKIFFAQYLILNMIGRTTFDLHQPNASIFHGVVFRILHYQITYQNKLNVTNMETIQH